jgi:D-amino-acid oxidase
VRLVTGWELFRSVQPEPEWGSIVGGVGRPSPGDIPAGYADGYEFTTPIVRMPSYLRWLVERLKGGGGTIVQERVGSLIEMADTFQLVINCTGLGSVDLAGDRALVPVRGQVLRVTNPGLSRFTRDDGHPEGRTYIYPRGNDCILGGTSEWGEARPVSVAAISERILRVCRSLEPRLWEAQVLDTLVGLRPWRPEVRVEVDSGLGLGGLVIHNYGHGGAGVTLAWGCAADVVTLALRGSE